MFAQAAKLELQLHNDIRFFQAIITTETARKFPEGVSAQWHS
jgi:hypothetical protein